MVNGDIYTDFPFSALQVPTEADAHLVLVPTPPYLKGGDLDSSRVA